MTTDASTPHYVLSSIPATKLRILLEGPAGYAWYLGERVSMQSLNTTSPRVPRLPPRSMLRDYRPLPEDISVGVIGWDATQFLMDEDADYKKYRNDYLVYKHLSIRTNEVRSYISSQLRLL